MMGLRHAVVTSVTRDDLPDGGAAHWAATVEAIRQVNPHTTIEVLIPDLWGEQRHVRTVADSRPDILGHNIECVERLAARVRSVASYDASLRTLAAAADGAAGAENVRLAPGADPQSALRKRSTSRSPQPAQAAPLIKSGLMVGLGERPAEVLQALRDLRAAGVDIVTIGQYLQPSPRHMAVAEYVTPEQFEDYRMAALEMGFGYVASAPLVRSSYMAHRAMEACATSHATHSARE